MSHSHTIVLLFFVALFFIPFLGTALAHAEPDPVRHVVVFDYADDASQEQIDRVTDAFRDLQHEIPGVISFEHGVNNSPEDLNQSYTHVYQLTFESEEARDTYLTHPAHVAFGELLNEIGILEGAFVVDYTPGE